ncbi:hypothetical protein BCR34DRAFT_590497 [Clohesyomyces aquaticus]|uniref:Uncharacterized protein n=1 Tax=Clohesyomyces aquaticus TaxID=1231657 RepID=A0A1Y1Z9N8_9PLEO|nr:hypothetical protein BCR34DRAFT_590497 [Clohesyomyces aquaticus]
MTGHSEQGRGAGRWVLAASCLRGAVLATTPTCWDPGFWRKSWYTTEGGFSAPATYWKDVGKPDLEMNITQEWVVLETSCAAAVLASCAQWRPHGDRRGGCNRRAEKGYS